jgi:predicted nucleic acid-binding protein
MNMFVDTSAFLAVLDGDDSHHKAAKSFWIKILEAGDVLVCHNYILVETSALISRRLGMEAVRVFEQDVMPILKIIWITEEVHFAASGAQLVAGRSSLSLVDCVSFEVMRRTGVQKAFAFDRHFKDYGYELYPKSR